MLEIKEEESSPIKRDSIPTKRFVIEDTDSPLKRPLSYQVVD